MVDVQELLDHHIFHDLGENVGRVKTILVKNADLVQRDFSVREAAGPACTLFYIDGLSNNMLIDAGVLRPLIIDSVLRDRIAGSTDSGREHRPAGPHQTAERLLINPEVKFADTYQKAIDGLLAGESLLFIDGVDEALLVGTKGWESRSPGETATEVVIRGPRDGFTENIRTNTSLIRRRIKDPMFRLESLQIGTRTKTFVNVVYIEGIAKQELVDEVMTRLESIQVDSVLESGYLEELISDAPWSPFRTVKLTERPDVVAAAILEGRVAILTDSTPFVLVAPTSFWEGLMASDDYYSHFYLGTFSRIIRYIAFIVSLTLSSIYVMLVSFHQEMIPTELALSVAAGRETVPFPVLVEVLGMETAFELMREAGLRMPRPIGQAVSIVGSLIIGQAAVQAGLVSPIMVIVVAVTGISSFAIPSYSTSFTIRLLRFPIIIASGTLGLLGFVGAMFVITVHALSLRSFGEPFLAPMIPFQPSDQKDALVRSPWWMLKSRPWIAKDVTRQGNDQMPKAPKNNGSGKADLAPDEKASDGQSHKSAQGKPGSDHGDSKSSASSGQQKRAQPAGTGEQKDKTRRSRKPKKILGGA
ncbi:spore germination protein [Alicyclobacillus ferrooxydans]|uniref:spore germination protein n=1 Tax=Alicyclobacillus ferrooxydans TaxID=471514 RepID=UPI001FDF55CA|nr:spore germination protein [Alicyclobacillus ferrooxydans]